MKEDLTCAGFGQGDPDAPVLPPLRVRIMLFSGPSTHESELGPQLFLGLSHEEIADMVRERALTLLKESA